MSLSLSWHPGYYGLTFSQHVKTLMVALADVMIPGSEGYPSASKVRTAEFIEARVNPEQHALFEKLLAPLDGAAGPAGLAEWLAELDDRDPISFSMLRFFVYAGYYRSDVVIQAINDHGFDYHSPPQPYGYHVAKESPLPTHSRGSYLRTDQVKNVFGK